MSSRIHLHDGLGLWREVRSPRSTTRPALFLDRDGVVIEEAHYLADPDKVRLIVGARETIAKARRNGFAVVLITNQSGIARGYFDWSQFAAVQDRMHALLGPDATLDAVYACGFHPVAANPALAQDHAWRKPNAGMLRAAAEDLNIDLARSWVIGDRASDLAAGKAAGLKGGSLVATGYGSREAERIAAQTLRSATFDVALVADVGDQLSATLTVLSGRSSPNAR